MDLKTEFETALRNTGRKGVEDVLTGLEKLGFFYAPASSRFHGCKPGGLLEHSINVYRQALLIREIEISLNEKLSEKLPEDSVAIASLLHDVCKAEIYKPCKKNRKNEDGKWESYDSWECDYAHCPLGHGEKSVIRILKMGLDLSPDEMLAIRWHMGKWDLSDSGEAVGNFNSACDKSCLLNIIIAADNLATRLIEDRGN